ncbi:MAG: hypothetical protein LBI81_03405 [Puniceicoccales bacterium]|jgi:hypothetical protein|nr:hypothetical protein [Puniceicoccales bacterium]
MNIVSNIKKKVEYVKKTLEGAFTHVKSGWKKLTKLANKVMPRSLSQRDVEVLPNSSISAVDSKKEEGKGKNIDMEKIFFVLQKIQQSIDLDVRQEFLKEMKSAGDSELSADLEETTKKLEEELKHPPKFFEFFSGENEVWNGFVKKCVEFHNLCRLHSSSGSDASLEWVIDDAKKGIESYAKTLGIDSIDKYVLQYIDSRNRNRDLEDLLSNIGDSYNLVDSLQAPQNSSEANNSECIKIVKNNIELSLKRLEGILSLPPLPLPFELPQTLLPPPPPPPNSNSGDPPPLFVFPQTLPPPPPPPNPNSIPSNSNSGGLPPPFYLPSFLNRD